MNETQIAYLKDVLIKSQSHDNLERSQNEAKIVEVRDQDIVSMKI